MYLLQQSKHKISKYFASCVVVNMENRIERINVLAYESTPKCQISTEVASYVLFSGNDFQSRLVSLIFLNFPKRNFQIIDLVTFCAQRSFMLLLMMPRWQDVLFSHMFTN